MLARSLMVALLSLACQGCASEEQSASPRAAAREKAVGLCLRFASTENRVDAAQVMISSGDRVWDEKMRAGTIGMPGPHHSPPGKWLTVWVHDDNERQVGAAPVDHPPGPEFDCSALETSTKP
jgi:hypothetical protein